MKIKSCVAIALAGLLVSGGLLLSGDFGSVKNAETAHALESKAFYDKDDVIVIVYELSCESGVGGFTVQVDYDGDNLDFDKIFIDEKYTSVSYDNKVGRVKISALNPDTKKTSDKVKIAVAFRTMYMLDASFIEFTHSVLNFVDSDIEHTENYHIEESGYFYDKSFGHIGYEEYVNSLIVLDEEDSDTETDIDTDSDTDTETDIDTDSDVDTETDIDTDSDTDTETDIDTDSDSDTETDIDTDSDTDTETDIDTDSDTDTETDIGTDSDTDTETDVDTETDIDTDSDTNTSTDTAPQNPTVTKYIYGDVDFDGMITSGDALFILRGAVELEEFSQIRVLVGDVDGDGEITSADSLAVLRHSVGLSSDLPIGKEFFKTNRL